MKNLKKLLAAILTVVLLASMIVPALATVENAEKGVRLQAIGLMAGGLNDLRLDEGLNRIQGLTFAIRAAGKEAEALSMSSSEVESILANVVDRDKIPNWANGYAQKYVAYAVKHKYTLGTDSTILPKVRFGPMDPISGTSFLVFLMKSGMGYNNVTTQTVIDEALAAKVLTASQAVKYGSKVSLIRDDAAGILYEAAMNGINANGKKLIDALIESGFVKRENAINAGFISDDAALTMTVSAVGARKLEVLFSKAVDSSKAVIDVKREMTSPLVKSVTYANDSKSAVIEFVTDMIAGVYTVTVTGVSDQGLSAVTTVSDQKLTTIKFLSDVAIKKGSDIAASVVGENQYGEDVTYLLNSASVWASSGTGASIMNGVVTVKGTSSDYFKTNQSISITITESTSGVSATKALKIGDAAVIDFIVFGDLATDDTTLTGKQINVDAMSKNADKYYLPITVKDQYGNIFKAEDLTSIQVYTSDAAMIKLADPPIINHSEKGTVLKFQNTGHEKSGTVIITALAPTTGRNASKSITIMDKPKIDRVVLSAPAGTLKQNTAVILPVTVYDMNNKLMDLSDISIVQNGSTLTLNTNTFMTAVGGTLSVRKDYLTGATNIILTPTAKNIIVTVSTQTSKVQTLNLTASDPPVPTYIFGVKPDVATVLANDSSLSTVLKDNIVFLDQYSEETTAPVYKQSVANGSEYYYTIREKSTNNFSTSFNSGTGTVYSSPNAGSELYIIELRDKDSKLIHYFEVAVTVVNMKDITSFVIKDLNKFYTDVSGIGTHNQTIEVYGLYGGKRVVVNQDIIMNISATNGLTGINTATRTYIPVNIDTKGEDRTAELTVFVYNGTDIIPVTQNVVFSNATPVAQALDMQYGGVKINLDEVNIPYYELSNKSLIPFGTEAGRSKLQFIAKDQYGVQKSIDRHKFVVTNNSTGGSITTTGFASGYSAADSGKLFQLAVFVDNLYKMIKIVVVQ